MANGSPGSGYLYLVTYEGVTSMLNRQQLLGSMPKMLDNLEAGDSVLVEPIEQSLFTQAITAIRDQMK